MRPFAPRVLRSSSLVRLVAGATFAVAAAFVTIQAQIPGRNVNMVSGIKWPEGDPFLQRQNEPSVAASTRNPLHLLGGSNDYRTVDVPGLCNAYGPDPENPGKQICVDGVETGDAWLGLFKSTDGGQRWISTLLPGYPQDQSPAGLASPLKSYQAGADAVVRAGTSGLLYYSGLVFDRAEDGKSGVFLARFIDNNNQESGDPIAYLGTKLVASSNGAKFLDKPWMAVDIPRSNAVTCTVTSDNILPTSQDGRRRKHGYDRDERHDGRDDRGRSNDRYNNGRGNGRDDDRDNRGRGGRPSPKPPKPPKPMVQRIPAGAIYVAYSSITGDASTLRSEILLTRSMDCGNTWSAPIKVSRPEDAVNQGSSLTIDPRTGAVYVGWRRFDPNPTGDLDAIMVARLPFGASKFDTPNRAHKFRKPERKVGRKLHRLFEHRSNRFKDVPANEAQENLDQFDLGTTGFNFRTNAYPTMATDGTGRVYIAWTQRGFAADPSSTDTLGVGGARIVIATTKDGRTFSTPHPVDDHSVPGRGHQLMPSMAFAGGKLMLVFYDMRDSAANTHNRIASDYNTQYRQTIDIRSAMASPGDNPQFADSVKVSDYLTGFNPATQEIEELQVNPPNLPMFKLGTVPFIGDYIDVAAAPAFIPTGNGKWAYNTASTGALPTFHAVWTDNRDVRPPRDGNWTNYAPPTKMTPEQLNGLSIFDGSVVPQCVDGAGNPGSRNQNVYSARITGGLLAGSPGNAKPLSTELQRGFVVFAQNTSRDTKSFRMTILSQPPGGRASFDQFPAPPYVGAVPPPETAIEMIVPPLSTASRTVYVTSSDPKAQLNVDVVELADLRTTSLPYPSVAPVAGGLAARVILNPDIENPDIENPDIENPDIENPDIENTEVYNPDIENPDIENPDIENPDIENPDIENPDIENPDIENPDIENVRVANPDIENPNIFNPDIENPDIENPDIENPDIENPDIENGAIADITWKVSNDGNTTASFNVNLFLAQQQLPTGVKTQLILLKTYRTPVTVRNGCQLAFQTRNILLANIRNPILVPPGGGTANANDPAETNATLWLAPGEEGRIVLRVIDEDTSNNVPVTKANGDVEYIDPGMLPTEDVSPVVQQQAVNSEDVDEGPGPPPVVTPPAPPATADTVWTTPGTPVRVNVLANDAALFGSTKIITTHPAGLAQNMGGTMQELVYMPTTGLLYVGGSRSIGVVDRDTNHLVGRMPIDPSDPGATYGRSSPSTGLIFFRMGGNGQPASTLYAYDARPTVLGVPNPTFHQVFGISVVNGAAIDNLGDAFTFTLGNAGKVVYYVAGTVTGTGPTQTVVSTLSAIDADPASTNPGEVLWTVPLAANARPQHVVQNPATGKLYIAMANVGSGPPQGGVFVVNPAALAPPTKILGADQSLSLAVNPSTNLIFAAGLSGNFRLNAIDGTSDTVISQLLLTGSGTRFNNAEDRLVVHIATGKVFLRTQNHVFVVDGLKGSAGFNTTFTSLPVGTDFGNSDLVVNQATGIVVTGGNFTHGVTLIDAATNATTNLPMPRASGELAVDPTTTRVFAIDFLNAVHRFDTDAPVVTSLTVFPETGLAIPNPVTNRAYVSAAGVFSDISVVSGLGPLGTLPSLGLQKGRWGFGGRHDATNAFFFVNSASDVAGGVSRPGALARINGANDAVTDLIDTIGQPFGLGVNQNTGQVIVAGFNGINAVGANENGKIRVHEAGNPSSWVDADTALVVPQTPTAPAVSFGRHVVTNHDTNLTYVMVIGGSNTSVAYLPPAVLPGVVGPVVQPIALPATFGGVNFNTSDRVEVIRTLVLGPGNSRVFLGTFNGSQYKVLALDGNNTVVGAYAGGGHSRQHTASWLEVNPNDGSLFVVDFNGDTVTKLDATTLAFQAVTTLPDGPSATAFNVSQNRLYVSSITSKTITALNGTSLAIASSVQLPLNASFLRVNESEGRIYTTGGNSQDESGTMVISDVGGQLGASVDVTTATDGAGETTVNDDNSLTYLPAPGFSGTDTITYTARTAAGDSIGTVTVNVIPVATVPVAFGDAFATPQGVTLNVNVGRGVLANDLVSASATMQVVEGPATGVLTPSLTNPGQFTYAPNGLDTGLVTFKYLADDTVDSNVATVSINVLAPSGASSLVVVNTSDTGLGSLRNAINYANTAPGSTITFNIAAGPMGPPYVITPVTPLPAISDAVIIAGLSQPGSGGMPSVVISGSSLPLDSTGLVVSGNGSTIRALVINNFAPSAIFAGGSAIVLSGDNNIVENSFLGTAVGGSAPASVRTYTGVKVTGSNNRVGGPGIAQRNVMANTHQGVWLVSGSGNVVAYNNIGANFAGTAAVPAAGGDPLTVANQFGVLVDGGTGAAIGNQGTSLNNVISGNGVGVQLRAGTGTVIAHNHIGLDVTGMNAIPNGDGVSLYPSIFGVPTDTTIGGNSPIRTNRISGNTGWGINLDGDTVVNTSVFNNIIGLNVGNAAVPNLLGGIRNVGAAGTVIGGPTRGNVISGNDGPSAFGILIAGNTDGATIQANRIGTDLNGTSARPNGPAGGDNAAIFVDNGSSDVVIGGSIAAGEGNLISGNSAWGVKLWGNNNHVRGNLIGTTATGLAALPNGKYGVHIEVGSDNTVGGIGGGDWRNVISGNAQGGVIVSGQGAYAGAFGTVLSANAIGVGSNLSTMVPNGGPGVDLREGTSTEVADNIIRGNTGAGVLAWQGTTGNLIGNNAISDNGGLGIDLDNNGPDVNDPGDADPGSNNRQNYPVLSNAINNAGAASVTYDTTSFAPGVYVLRFYANAGCDPSGFGEGEQLVGSLTVGAGVTGIAGLSPLATVGKHITATATDGGNNTSEFSACTAVTAGAPPAVITSASPNTLAAGFGQMIWLEGNNLAGLTAADVIVKSGGNDYPVNYVHAINPARVIARLDPGTPLGAATIRVKAPGGPPVSNEFAITIATTPAPPVVAGLHAGTCSGGISGPGSIWAAKAGDQIVMAAKGVDTAYASFKWTQLNGPASPAPVAAVATCGITANGDIFVETVVPAFAPGTVWSLQLITSVGVQASGPSNAFTLTVEDVAALGGSVSTGVDPTFPAMNTMAGWATTRITGNYNVGGVSLVAAYASQLEYPMGTTGEYQYAAAGFAGPDTPFAMACPAGQVFTGLTGTHSSANAIQSLGAECKTANALAGGVTATTGPFGPTGTTPFAISCPAGTKMVGFQGQHGGHISGLGIICR